MHEQIDCPAVSMSRLRNGKKMVFKSTIELFDVFRMNANKNKRWNIMPL